MHVGEAPIGGAGWPDEVERWLLFRYKNSQERPRATVCGAKAGIHLHQRGMDSPE